MFHKKTQILFTVVLVLGLSACQQATQLRQQALLRAS
jgi:hypothetical protein